MPKGTPKPKVNKSAWIREQPSTLTAAEVVEKAKKEGIGLTVGQVYTTRSNMKTAKTAGPAKKKPGRPKKAAAAAPVATGNKVNKSAWIREQSSDLSAKEVVEKAAQLGIELSLAQVYTARSAAKTGGKSASKASSPVKASAAARAKVRMTEPGSPRQEFIRLATRLGTDAMRAMIDEMDQAS